jgi:hypothetical protein
MRRSLSEQALDNIALVMSGEEWDADTLDDIADIVREAGRHIAEYPLPPATIRGVTFAGQMPTFEQPAEPADLVIGCPLVGRDCDAQAWGGEATCLGDYGHKPHAIDLPDDGPDDDLALEMALEERRGI